MKFNAMCKTILRRTVHMRFGGNRLKKFSEAKKSLCTRVLGGIVLVWIQRWRNHKETIPLRAKPPHPPHVEHICITFSLYLSSIFLFTQFVYSSGGSSRYLVVERPALSDILLGQVPTSFTPHTSVANSTCLGKKKYLDRYINFILTRCTQ